MESLGHSETKYHRVKFSSGILEVQIIKFWKSIGGDGGKGKEVVNSQYNQTLLKHSFGEGKFLT